MDSIPDYVLFSESPEQTGLRHLSILNEEQITHNRSMDFETWESKTLRLHLSSLDLSAFYVVADDSRLEQNGKRPR